MVARAREAVKDDNYLALRQCGVTAQSAGTTLALDPCGAERHHSGYAYI